MLKLYVDVCGEGMVFYILVKGGAVCVGRVVGSLGLGLCVFWGGGWLCLVFCDLDRLGGW